MIQIKLHPYYSELLKWYNSVDVIRVPPYNGDPVKYPSKEIDPVDSDDMSYLLVDELLDYNVMTSSPMEEHTPSALVWNNSCS